MKQKGFILIPMVLVVVLFVILIYFLPKFYFIRKVVNNSPEPTPTTSEITPTLSSESQDWVKFTINTLNISYELPKFMADKVGTMTEKVKPGETGLILLVSPSKVNGGFYIGTTSVDFSEGRGGSYTDLQGFVKNGNEYSAKFVSGKIFKIPTELVTEVENSQFRIIRIIGKNETEGDFLGPVVGTPGEGSVGALINIPNNKTYTGLTVLMDLNQQYTIELFDQILSTFKFGPED